MTRTFSRHASMFALCLTFAAHMPSRASSDAVVQPLTLPEHVAPGPICVLPPMEAASPKSPEATQPAVHERRELPSEPASHAEHPLLCACAPLDALVDEEFMA